MIWLLLGIGILSALPLISLTMVLRCRGYMERLYMDQIARIFLEKPLFVIPRGSPVEQGVEMVRLTTPDGMRLRGAYFRTVPLHRKGVILFGLEFGSNLWSALPYAQCLIDNGYDVFVFEPRNQGESDTQAGYEPLQWFTKYERCDTETALNYLLQRKDADPSGVGYFGVSKGGSAGLVMAARHPQVRCVVTDGAFGTYSTMVPYMRKWVALYSQKTWLQELLPSWAFRTFARWAIEKIQAERQLVFVDVDRAAKSVRVPLLMIHGNSDGYIKPTMARELFKQARGEKSFWAVENAKHNQALHTAGEEYHTKVVNFFDRYLALPAPPEPETVVEMSEAAAAEIAAEATQAAEATHAAEVSETSTSPVAS